VPTPDQRVDQGPDGERSKAEQERQHPGRRVYLGTAPGAMTWPGRGDPSEPERQGRHFALGSGPADAHALEVDRTMGSVVVTKRGADRFRRGLVWVFRCDLAAGSEAEPGAIVRVVDARHNFVCHALYGPGELALRLLSREQLEPGPELFRRRLGQAIAHRRELFGDREALRLVHAEADLLPGLLVDRYADGVVVQSLCTALDQREQLVVDLLVELLAPRVVVVRDDGGTRELEGLPRRKSVAYGADPRVSYEEAGIRFTVDLLDDQKTGGYLDQAENRRLAGARARGRCLDLFSYHGGFGLQMARQADHVLCVELDPAAAGRLRQNVGANGLDARVEVRQGNAFDELRAAQARGDSYQTIVVDPPAFAKRKSALEAALRGYRELYLRALRLLAPGAILFACSCSARLGREPFEQMLVDAAADAKRRVVILERRGAGADHPVLLGVPETEYLKCLVLKRVD